MADAPAKTPEGKSAFGFLGKKVFGGKVPIWLLAVGAIGAYYFYSKRKGAAGTQTDPAGNTCATVNPATGYCPGTPEDLAAQQANAGTTDTTGTAAAGGTTDTTGAGGGAGGTGGTAGGTGTGGTGTGTTGTGTTDTGTGTATWTDQSGTQQTGTPADFAAAFAATGTNAGQIVPGGTGTPIAAPSASAKPGAQNAHQQHLAHVAHVAHLAHVAATRKQPKKKPVRA